MKDRKQVFVVDNLKMLHLPNNGFQIFEVALYNEAVRELVNHNQKHCYFDDRWAKLQTRDVVARDEVEARTLIAERFPPQDGFVVQRVSRGAI
jgi:hypothetical protein